MLTKSSNKHKMFIVIPHQRK